MIKTLVAILFVTLLFATPLFAQQAPSYSRAKIWLDAGHTLAQLSRLGIAVDHGQYRKGVWIITDCRADELQAARSAGFQVDVLVEDVAAHYAGNGTVTGAQKPAGPDDCSGTGSAQVSVPIVTPSHFHLGSYAGRYFGYAELLTILDSMQLLYPNLISVRQAIGTFQTYEGRPVYWVRISNNPGVEQPAKPQMLYTAVHHAREPGGLNALVYYLWYLLENYGTNDKVTAIVNNTELYFVPCLNPDGYLYNEVNSPAGGGMWRKNRKPNGDGTIGVDLNRNYGFQWGYDDNGSSPVTSSLTYRGPSPFSEAETQAAEWLCNQHQFRIALNYHTWSNLLIYPWGYIASFKTPDSSVFDAYGAYLTDYNHYHFGTGDQTVGYVTNGDSDDWMYGEQGSKPKILSMTPEAGDEGFYPPVGSVLSECAENLTANVDASGLLLPFARVASLAPPAIATATAYLPYRLKRMGLTDGPYTVAIVPISAGLSATGGPQSFPALALLESAVDSFAVSIAAGTLNGALLAYALEVNNGYYTSSDTFSFMYGAFTAIAQPSTTSLAGWTTGGWGVDNQYFFSPPSCLSESPMQPYPADDEATLTLASPADLTTAQSAYLEFWARWDVEDGYDYVVVEGKDSTATAWQQLCGLYTTPGSADQLVDMPLYDGVQTTWVQEHIDLAPFLGKKMNLRFRRVSDGFMEGEGFFLDDVRIMAATNGLGVQEASGQSAGLRAYPNPATGELRVQVPQGPAAQSLTLTDATGRAVLAVRSEPGTEVTIPVEKLARGIYFLKTSGGSAAPVKVVLR